MAAAVRAATVDLCSDTHDAVPVCASEGGGAGGEAPGQRPWSARRPEPRGLLLPFGGPADRTGADACLLRLGV